MKLYTKCQKKWWLFRWKTSLWPILDEGKSVVAILTPHSRFYLTPPHLPGSGIDNSIPAHGASARCRQRDFPSKWGGVRYSRLWGVRIATTFFLSFKIGHRLRFYQINPETKIDIYYIFFFREIFEKSSFFLWFSLIWDCLENPE